MAELSALNIKITGDATDLKAAVGSATTELGKITTAADRANAGSARLATGLGNTGAAAAGSSHMLRGVAQQLSQVGQQTMATGNFVQALAIQLPDIGIGFGAIGAAAGLLAGIALPLLMSAFGGTGAEAKSLSDALDDMDEAVSNFTSSAQASSAPMIDLAEKYGTLAKEARAALEAMAGADRIVALNAVREAITAINANLLETVTAREALLAGGGIRQLSDDFGLLQSQASAVRDALVALETAQGVEAQVAAARRLMRALDDARNSAGELPPELQLAYDAAARIVPEVAAIAGATDVATASARALGDGFGYAASRAYDVRVAAAQAAAAIDAFNAASLQGSKQYGGRGGDPREFMNGGGGAQNNTFGGAAYNPKKGGGGTNPIIGELETLQNSLMTQEQLQLESYTRQQETLRAALDQRLITQTEYAAMMEASELQHANQMAVIKTQEAQMVSDAARSMYGELEGFLNMFAGKSKAAAIASIALNKGLRIAEIIQNTAAAQMRAYAELGPVAGAVAAAKIGMMGKLQAGIVAASGLMQAGGAGRSGGGSAAGAGAGAVAQSSPTQTLNFTITNDPFGFGERVVRQIAEQLNQAQRNGVNIRAVVN